MAKGPDRQHSIAQLGHPGVGVGWACLKLGGAVSLDDRAHHPF